jgi:hypothetical protein
MGTQYFDSSGLGGEDFPVPELLQMLGLASPPQKDDAGVAVLMCHAAKKEYYKKFLFEPLPVESHLDMCLHDFIVRPCLHADVLLSRASRAWRAMLMQVPHLYKVCHRSWPTVRL